MMTPEKMIYENKINDLEQQLKYFTSKSKRLEQENKRLNNIIDELEKVINYELSEIRKNNDYNIGLKNVSHIYKRLQELKEGK